MQNNRWLGFFLCILSGVVNAVPNIETWMTPEGAKVMYVHAPELPMIDVRVVFDAGSARDGSLGGLASMTNRVLASSAGEWDANALAKRLDAVGAELGHGSLKDMAWLSMRSLVEPAILDTALSTLNALLHQPNFADADVARVRQMMLASLLRDEQSPGAIGKKWFMQTVYGDHPYGMPSGGTEASVKALGVQQLKAYFQQYYVAKNALVVIVGAVDRQQAEGVVKKIMAGMPSGHKPAPLPKVVDIAKNVDKHIAFPSSQSHLMMGHPGMKRGDPDYFVLYVGNHILGGSGLVSLLGEEVREKRGLSYSVYSYFSPMRYEGPFLLAAQTKNAQAEKTVNIIKQTLSKFIDTGPTEAQLLASKQKITGGFPLRIASNGKIVSYLAMIGFYDLPITYLDEFVGKIESITVAQIKEAFQRRVHPDKMVTLVVGEQVMVKQP